MNGFEAILLGVVQGLTEFLPVSSSGHLILVPWIGDIQYLQQHPQFNKTFDVALHLGTLIGVVAYFREDIRGMVRGTLSGLRKRRAETGDERLALVVAIATVPAVIAGGLGESWIDERLGEPWQIAILLAAFALALAYADRRPERHGIHAIGPRQALQIGLAQAVALAPGVSRSGVTITAGRLLGFDRDTAARFSFFLLVPATAGAVVLKGAGVVRDGLPDGAALPMALGVGASAVSGYLAIAWLLAFVRGRSYDVFVGYRLLAASAVGLLILTGVRSATF